MTHDELLARVATVYDFIAQDNREFDDLDKCVFALRAVVELHKPSLIPDWVPTEEEFMCWCAHVYPCPTIQAIEKELK